MCSFSQLFIVFVSRVSERRLWIKCIITVYYYFNETQQKGCSIKEASALLRPIAGRCQTCRGTMDVIRLHCVRVKEAFFLSWCTGAQTAASGIPLPRSLSPQSPGELQTGAWKPTHFPYIPPFSRAIGANSAGGDESWNFGGETQAVAPSAHLWVTIHTFSSARRRDYGSFLGENRERGGIGHESSHNPRWRAKALAFKKNYAYVTWNSSGDSSGAVWSDD